MPDDAPTVGINRSFHTHTLFPLYHNFFSELGFRVVLPDKVLDEGVEREQTALCFPGQISHGLFEDLLLKKPDYIFVPNVLEMDAEEKKYQRIDFNCTCIFVSGEPYLLKEAFREYDFEDKLISPILNFGNGIESDKEKFYEIGEKLGITDKNKIERAFQTALKKQNEYYAELKRIGSEFINFLGENPDEYAIVLVGRPYNAFAENANKGIPRKFASRGVYVLPYEMLDYSQETIDDDMYWEGGKKILRSAKVIKKQPNLFATYISNFSCAPDSILVTMFRRIMGTKPSLTLELDSHSADAGINTRIDAALDIIKNHRMVSRKIKPTVETEFRPAKVAMTEDGVRFFASDGSKVPLDSPRVDILLPSMGDLANRLFAAGIRSQGYNAIPLKQSNPDILKYGRAHATGKECLPLMLCTGLMIDYLENEWDGKQYVCFFIVQGAGNCRLGYYPTFMKNVIKDKKIPNVAMLELMHEEGFAGLGPKFSSRGIETLIASDVIDDIRSAIMAHAEDPEAGLEIFNREFDKFVSIIEQDYSKFYPALKNFAKNIKENIPAEKSIDEAKYIAMVGEMYVRRDPFAFKWLNRHFAEQGFILKDAYVSEWIFYVDYLLKEGYYEPLKSLKNKYERFVRISYMKMADYRIKKALEKSGYYKYYKTDVKPLVENGKHIVPPEFKGEPLLVAGAVLNDAAEKYCGVINIGPFGCMQSRFAEAVTAPNANLDRKFEIKQKNNMKYEIPKIFNGQRNIPFLSIETDGNVYPQVIEARLETFALQAERMAEMMKLSKNGHK